MLLSRLKVDLRGRDCLELESVPVVDLLRGEYLELEPTPDTDPLGGEYLEIDLIPDMDLHLGSELPISSTVSVSLQRLSLSLHPLLSHSSNGMPAHLDLSCGEGLCSRVFPSLDLPRP